MSTPASPSSSNRAMRAGTITASIALIALIFSATLFLVPVANPGVQRCGSPAWFLLKATSDQPLYDTQGNPIHGWDQTQLNRANQHRCSKQVANRAVPAAILLLGFWAIALIATALGYFGKRSLKRSIPSELLSSGTND